MPQNTIENARPMKLYDPSQHVLAESVDGFQKVDFDDFTYKYDLFSESGINQSYQQSPQS